MNASVSTLSTLSESIGYEINSRIHALVENKSDFSDVLNINLSDGFERELSQQILSYERPEMKEER